jgi:hypothetical protein
VDDPIRDPSRLSRYSRLSIQYRQRGSSISPKSVRKMTDKASVTAPKAGHERQVLRCNISPPAETAHRTAGPPESRHGLGGAAAGLSGEMGGTWRCTNQVVTGEPLSLE